MNTDPRYPIGKFDREAPGTREDNIQTIRSLPSSITAAVENLTDPQLDTSYREGGWTLRQTVHHVADSHMNSYCRFKLALTEDSPTICPYDEGKWAELSDSLLPVDVSLKIIEGVHERWADLLASMTDDDFERELTHPETGPWKLDKLLGLYAWHSRHHTAHITGTRERSNW